MRRVITIDKDEKYLRQISKEIKFTSKRLQKYIEDLKEYCKAHEVMALAAIQIGIPKRIIYLKNTNLKELENTEYDESRILINPVIISRRGHTQFWEACASCLDNTGLVDRPYKIKIEYCDQNGNKTVEEFKGFEATVLSHEYDHLNGILHIDISKEILHMNKEERMEFRRAHPYKIISKTCDFDDIKKNN